LEFGGECWGVRTEHGRGVRYCRRDMYNILYRLRTDGWDALHSCVEDRDGIQSIVSMKCNIGNCTELPFLFIYSY
jgi:hypothetical protein